MESEFVEITLGHAAKAFETEKPESLQGHARLTLRVGIGGVTGICRDPKGGFDIFGWDNQHFWVPETNVVWARKVSCP